jgi:hypothetical protein
VIAVRLVALRLPHALAAAAMILAAIAIWPWLVPPGPATRPLAAPQASAPASSFASLPPLAAYAAIVERPLFAPTRRPAPGAAASGASADNRFRLIGIVGTGPKRKAFVADGTRRSEVAEGDALDGRTVKEIGQDRVVLSSPAGETVLKLVRTAPEPAKPQ